MSDGSISQDEIDALLSGVGGGGIASAPAAGAGDDLAAFKKTAMLQFTKENIPGLSSNLESMTGKTVSISEPVIELSDRETFLRKVSEMAVATLIDFSGAMSGDHAFMMSPELAKKIVSLVNHEDNVEIDDMALSVISETIAQYVGTELSYLERAGLTGVASSPAESSHVPKAMMRLPQRNFVSITYNVKLDDSAYQLWEILSEDVVDKITSTIAGPDPSMQGMGGDTGMQGMAAMGGMQNMGAMQNNGMMGGMQMGSMQTGGPAQQMFGSGMPQGSPQQGGNMQAMNNMGMMPQMGMGASVQPVQFPPLQGFVSQEEQGNIGLIMDVYMEMTVELGRTKRMIKEILGMGEGHIIELDKLAGEPVDVLVNHKPIAKGEVVVIEESFGVRITEILSPAERISDI
ncbi:flagellar motor switch protein FliN [Treponema denticola]|uniref:Flagellar motor switch protein FliN n=1 Tax=Treponema denticola SP33 TaxID=999437 RepID=M2BYS6_TREDN|nr:flagellar motor switch protein FliN [Treponema denticola]EMB27284.1 flagellar motor switch protein FliN [Treponema denticola SP33]EPF37540.1 flagellar motor switch protein FliN [Treponema denticola SP32]UTD13278.1 flagellar motor switch protein FliN [Treponema denticola]